MAYRKDMKITTSKIKQAFKRMQSSHFENLLNQMVIDDEQTRIILESRYKYKCRVARTQVRLNMHNDNWIDIPPTTMRDKTNRAILYNYDIIIKNNDFVHTISIM